jgi:phosphatidylserine/phosphatidylglycerophosphate/cardiolipin synthase-like enzyme
VHFRTGLLRRVAVAVTVALALSVTTTAGAVTFDEDDRGALAAPTAAGCPTIEAPAPYATWFNITDMEQRGYVDPKVHEPWPLSTRIAQVICGAAKGSEIKIGMFFIRALGTLTDTGYGERPESDPEVIYDALEWVKLNRGVKIGLVLDGGEITPKGARNQIQERLRSIATLDYCTNGCFNTNGATVFPYAINHEKFVTISDTVWASSRPGPHPAVLSTSTNFARSQQRNYHQEVTLIYDDLELFRQFDLRYDGMTNCADTGCSTSAGFPAGLKLSKQRGIWVDPIYRHYTDAGRGTSVSFSPQTPQAVDFYVQQFNDVDCTVDRRVRIAMFKLTDSKAEQMVRALVRLRERGCDVKMLLTYQGGALTISPTVAKLLTQAKINTRCTNVAMHTKMILIGPEHNVGRVLAGTQNMSVSGLRYNEEHVITFDPRRASAAYQEPLRRLYEEYMNGWYEFSQSTRSCT